MNTDLKVYRLVPLAAADDANWQNAPSHGEIVVCARTSGDARVVAAEAELDFREIDAAPAEDTSTVTASAFRNERLYTVIEDSSGRYSTSSGRGVVSGIVTVDTIISTQV